jgi:D-beta-D-heptose 7-phosphate kinase/D-beta-D-heptose 1-phosphate adenosyltransferase
MLDKYIFGRVERISQEAPIPVVQAQHEKYVLGGAANVAHNIATLSGNAYLFGVLGSDVKKDIFLKISADLNINTDGVFTDEKRPTTEKTRVVINKQQLARIDFESTNSIDETISNKICESIARMKKLDIIIISDYAKGVVSLSLSKKIISFSKKNKIIIIADPKPKHKQFYVGVDLVKTNKKEAGEMSGISIEKEKDIQSAGMKIMEQLGSSVIITLGEQGMVVFEKGKKAILIPTIAREVFDVSGAGDTAIAAAGLALSSGANLMEAATLANITAGIKVTKHGTAPVTIEELRNYLKNEG